MTQYLLSVQVDESAEQPPEEAIQVIYKRVDVFNQKLMDRDAWVFGGGLHPSDTATVVDASGPDVLITDGPFVEAKEQVGGFWVLKADDLDTALAWATEASAACGGKIEVRPFQDEPEA